MAVYQEDRAAAERTIKEFRKMVASGVLKYLHSLGEGRIRDALEYHTNRQEVKVVRYLTGVPVVSES